MLFQRFTIHHGILRDDWRFSSAWLDRLSQRVCRLLSSLGLDKQRIAHRHLRKLGFFIHRSYHLRLESNLILNGEVRDQAPTVVYSQAVSVACISVHLVIITCLDWFDSG